MSIPAPTTSPHLDLPSALQVTAHGHHAEGHVHPGYDVFGIPHGGYLLGLSGSAVLAVARTPDIFSITAHYLRKAEEGPIDFTFSVVGGSRRFTTLHGTATQGGQVVISLMASVGDRLGIEGPAWTDRPHDGGPAGVLGERADTMSGPFTPPAVAHRVGLRLVDTDTGFASGRRGDSTTLRGTLDVPKADQLAALVACDITPPAVWNALGASGWVPTVELTAHVRARPSGDRLHVHAETHHVADGFLEEDAVVHDDRGILIVQSRQLARWSAPS